MADTLITIPTLQSNTVAMSLGTYDEQEHERRERKNATVDISEADTRSAYRGSVEFDSGESAEELLDKFQEITD